MNEIEEKHPLNGEALALALKFKELGYRSSVLYFYSQHIPDMPEHVSLRVRVQFASVSEQGEEVDYDWRAKPESPRPEAGRDDPTLFVVVARDRTGGFSSILGIKRTLDEAEAVRARWIEICENSDIEEWSIGEEAEFPRD